MKAILLLTVLIALPGWARADGGAMLLEHTLVFKDTQAAATDFRVDGMYTLHENLRNESAQIWKGLHIEIVRQANTGYELIPVVASEGVTFMANEPIAAWRPTVEVRIDELYLGIAGGGWQLRRNATATALELQFDETRLQPGQLLQLRLRVMNNQETTWRLRYTPLTYDLSRSIITAHA